MYKSDFNEIYNKIINQNKSSIATEGFLKDLYTAGKDKLRKKIVGDKGLYFNTGNAYRDLYEYTIALRNLFRKKIPDLPAKPFNQLTLFATHTGGKDMQNARQAGDKVAQTITDIDKAATTAISKMHDKIANVLTNDSDISEDVIKLIEVIIQAFRISKEKVIECLEQAVETIIDPVGSIKKKALKAIKQLNKITIKINEFTFDTIIMIAKILASIAIINVKVIIYAVKMLLKIQETLRDLAIDGIKAGLKIGNKIVVAAFKSSINNISITFKIAGSALKAVGNALETD